MIGSLRVDPVFCLLNVRPFLRMLGPKTNAVGRRQCSFCTSWPSRRRNKTLRLDGS